MKKYLLGFLLLIIILGILSYLATATTIFQVLFGGFPIFQ